MMDSNNSKRILLVTSDRNEWLDGASDEEHVKRAPYSVGAILFNLSKMGWTTSRAGLKTSRSLRKLAARIDTFKPTIIYTYGSTVALNPIFCRRFLCSWKGFKVVHGWDDAYGDIWDDLFGWPGRVLMNIVERWIVKKSDAVITLSRFLQQRGAKWGVTCEYIPNGADPVDRLKISDGKIKLTGRINLVYTGDQARWKRTADICEAMRHVPPNIKLYLTGQIYPYLKKYASENCIFLGFVSKEEQLSVMKQADIFICTADQDCNAKIQEYLRWERPYLGYDGRANLFFNNGENAVLCKPNDYPSAILRLADDSSLRFRLAANAKRDIHVFAWMEIAKLFDAAFRLFAQQPICKGVGTCVTAEN